MKKIKLLARKIAEDYHITLFIGIMLIVFGLVSGCREFFSNLLGFEIRFFHGILLLGILNVVMAVVFVLMGERIVESGIEPSGNELEKRVSLIEKKLEELIKQ